MQSPQDYHSDREEIRSPLNTTSRRDENYVEITLDIRDDTVAVHSVKSATGTKAEEAEFEALAKSLQKKRSFGASIVRNVSMTMRLASFNKQPHRLDRRSSAVAQHALKGLKFISKTDSGSGWVGVEKSFNELTATSDGLLPREKFGECIGKGPEFNFYALTVSKYANK